MAWAIFQPEQSASALQLQFPQVRWVNHFYLMLIKDAGKEFRTVRAQRKGFNWKLLGFNLKLFFYLKFSSGHFKNLRNIGGNPWTVVWVWFGLQSSQYVCGWVTWRFCLRSWFNHCGLVSTGWLCLSVDAIFLLCWLTAFSPKESSVFIFYWLFLNV